MRIEFDHAKRDHVLAERGIDIARAGELFDGFHLTRKDENHSLHEDRFHSIGMIDDDIIIVTWAPRNDLHRIVTMWKANDREREKYRQARDGPG